MKRLTSSFVLVLMAIFAGFVAPAVASMSTSTRGRPRQLGKVNFPIFCDPAVQPQFSSAVAMLHSFWYEKANDTFARVAEKDPACGMAYWELP